MTWGRLSYIFLPSYIFLLSYFFLHSFFLLQNIFFWVFTIKNKGTGIQRRADRLVNELAFLSLRRGDGLGDKSDAASSIANVSAFLPFRRGVI